MPFWLSSVDTLTRRAHGGADAVDMFDEAAIYADADELPATTEAMGRAIIAGCRHKLLTLREASLRALRGGFTEHVDLGIQLAALSSVELMRTIRGNTELSVTDLVGCFDWPDSSPSLSAEAGFESVGSEVPRYLREILEEEDSAAALSGEQRLHILEWGSGPPRSSRCRVSSNVPSCSGCTRKEMTTTCRTCTRARMRSTYQHTAAAISCA